MIQEIIMHSLIDRLFWILIAILIPVSVFFTAEVYRAKHKTQVSAKNLRISSGQKAVVKMIIDGDEFLAEGAGASFKVRILGIASFDPTLSDPLDQSAGENALYYLKKTILNNEIELQFDEFKVDSSERLLAYVHKNSVDIGEDMVSSGLTLVYVKYPFSRMKSYLRVQQNSMKNKTGLWSNPALEKRSLTLLKLWEQEGR